MNARKLSQHYGQLTGEERLRLMLAAQARGDEAELVSLWTSCPQMEIIGPDPNFTRSILRMLDEVRSVILRWVEVSHYVVRDRFLAMALKGVGDIALARKAEAQWRQGSAAWKGVESGITHFCAQTELPREQVLMLEPSPLIEEARNHLHPESRVSRALATSVLRRLQRAWAGAAR